MYPAFKKVPPRLTCFAASLPDPTGCEPKNSSASLRPALVFKPPNVDLMRDDISNDPVVEKKCYSYLTPFNFRPGVAEN